MLAKRAKACALKLFVGGQWPWDLEMICFMLQMKKLWQNFNVGQSSGIRCPFILLNIWPITTVKTCHKRFFCQGWLKFLPNILKYCQMF